MNEEALHLFSIGAAGGLAQGDPIMSFMAFMALCTLGGYSPAASIGGLAGVLAGLSVARRVRFERAHWARALLSIGLAVVPPLLFRGAPLAILMLMEALATAVLLENTPKELGARILLTGGAWGVLQAFGENENAVRGLLVCVAACVALNALSTHVSNWMSRGEKEREEEKGKGEKEKEK